MRRLRTIAACACASAALLVGIAAPAQSAPPAERATEYITPDGYFFGTYYTESACRYFGESLVAGGAWRYYRCYHEWRTGEPQAYWYLYMYNY